MDSTAVMAALLAYKYWVLLPLAIVEGPMLAFVCGLLISLGVLSFPITLFILVIGDLIPDTIFYTLGRYGSDSPLSKRVAASIGVTDEHFADAKRLWHEHPGKTMLMSKFAYGISSAFLFMAGLMSMPAYKFYGYSVSISIAHYLVIMAAGFYFGASLVAAGDVVKIIEFGIAGAVLLISGYLTIMWYMRKSFSLTHTKDAV